MIVRLSLSLLFSLILGLALFAQAAAAATQDKRAADTAAIRAHIESIFQAFLDGDVDKIYATHSDLRRHGHCLHDLPL